MPTIHTSFEEALVYVGTVVMNPKKQHKKLFDLQTKLLSKSEKWLGKS